MTSCDWYQTIVLAGSLGATVSATASSSLGESLTLDADSDSGATLTFGTFTIGSGYVLTVTNGSSDTLIIGGVLAGAGGLTKTGAGTLTLSGANTYTGDTTISAGTLATGAAERIADGSAVTVASGATFTIGGNESIFSLSGVAGSSVSLGANKLTQGGASAVTEFAGVISGTGGQLTLTDSGGGGSLTLSGANTYTGVTSVVNSATLILKNGAAIADTGSLRVNGSGTVTLLNNETVGSLFGNNTNAKVKLGNYTLTAGGDNSDTEFMGVISNTGTGNLVKTGSGTLTLSGTNTYTGTTTISGGALLVTGTLNGSTAGLVTVGSGGTLTGTGTVNGGVSVASGGTLAPGATSAAGTAGKLTVNGGLTVASGGTLAMDINGATTAGTSYDQVAVTGAVDVTGATLSLTVDSTYQSTGIVPGAGFTLIDNDAVDAITGAFTGLAQSATKNLTTNRDLGVSYTGGSGNDFVLTALNHAPTVGGTFTTAGTVNDNATTTPFANVTVGEVDNSGTVKITILVKDGSGNLTDANGVLSGTGLTKNSTGTYTLETSRAAAATVQSELRALIFTPTANQVAVGGTVDTHFTLTPNDGTVDGTADSTTKVTATSINDTPTLTSITTLTGATEDTAYTITYADLLAASNAADADPSSTLSFLIAAVSSGTLTKGGSPVVAGTTLLSAGESLVWTPAANVNGSGVNAFTVKANDGTASSGTAIQVKVDITAVNDAPTAIGLTNTTVSTFDPTNATVGTLSVTDVDGGGPTYSIVSVNAATSGTTFDLFNISGTGLRAASPSTMTTGDYTVVIRVNDGTSNYDQSFTITVDGSLIVTTAQDSGVDATIDGSYAADKADGGGLSLREALNYATTGSTIKFAASGYSITLGSDVTVADNVTLDGGITGGSDSLTIGGTGKLSLAGTLFLNNGSGDNFSISSVISDGSGTGALIKTGAGTLTLSGSNSYSGTTTINAGTLSITGDSGLGSGTAALRLNGGNLIITGTDTIDNAITLSTAGTITNANAVTLSGALSGSGELTKDGAGTLTLSNISNSSATGALAIIDGTVSVASDTRLVGGDIVLNGGNLTITGADTIDNAITLSAAATITNANAVTLSGVLSDSGTLTKAGGGTLTLSGPNTRTGATTVSAGTLAIASDAKLGTGTATITLAAGTTLAITGAGTIDNAITLSGTASVDVANSISATLSGVIGGTGFGLTKTGAGTLTLTNTNTYTGATLVSAGTLTASGGSAISDSSAVTVTGTLVLSNAETIGSLAGAGTVTLGSNTLTVGADTTSTTFSGAINGTGGLTKTGSGTLTLSGTNGFTGALTVSAGGVTVRNGAAIADSVAATVTGTLTVYNNETIGSLAGAGTVTVMNGGTLTVGGDNSSTTFSGVIGGAGALTKTGSGTFTLSNTDTYTGATTVNGGILLVTGSTASGSAVTVASGGTLGGSGTIHGSVSVASGGTLSPGVAGTNSGAGTLSIGGGLTISSGGTLAADITGATAGTGYDQVVVIGTVTITGSSLSLTVGYTPGQNDTYKLIDNDAADDIAGTFSGVAQGGRVSGGGRFFTTSYAAGSGNDLVLTPLFGPTITAAKIAVSGHSGLNNTYKIGDTIHATWNNTAGSGDNNSGITGVTFDFSAFGGGAAVTGTNSGGTWSASYIITSGAIDLTGRNVSVSATDGNGTLTTAGTDNVTVDDQATTVTDANISLSGASGTGGAYKIGDTVTVTWSATADGNSDTLSTVKVDLSQFGGGSAVTMTNNSGSWTASYTIAAGALDAVNRNVTVTVTDNAGNVTATADTTNATVDDIAPTVTAAKIAISGATGTGGVYKIGDTVTATWNNSGSGDNNSDTISGATVDFSQFGGGVAVNATNSGGTWTATYTIVGGAIDGTGKNVSVTATDNAGNTKTMAGTTNAGVDNVAPTVTDAKISISGHSGLNDTYKIGDIVTATWNNTGSGDNETDTLASVKIDFSQFGGGTAVAMTNSGGSWTATYTIIAGAIDATGRNVAVTVTDNAGNVTTTADSTNATVDDIAPTVTDGRISIGGASGTGGTYKIGDTVTATWNNTGAGDNNSDTLTGVTVDLSQFGGGSAVTMTNNANSWIATYTIVAGSIDTTGRNVTVTVTDNAGNTKVTADTTNAKVDNIAPTVTDANISISGASGTDGAYKIGDIVTATWTNSDGDNETDSLASVKVDFSQFGGGSAVTMSNSGGIWTAKYTLVAGAVDAVNRNVAVSVTDNAGNVTTTSDTTNATVDSIAPTVTDGKISLSGASGTGGAYKIGDTVTVTWNNTGSGDNTTDTLASVTVNLSQFGGDQAVDMTNNSGSWTASYTIVAGTIDATNRNVAVTVTDNAGNVKTTADTTNATVDSIAPTVTDEMISLSGARGTDGAFKVGDTVIASWNAGNDGNTDTLPSVTANFSQFGGGTAVSATKSGGIWSAKYTITAGVIDATGRNVSFTVSDNAGNTVTTADSTDATVDNTVPIITAGAISISGHSGLNSAYKVGDIVTATWNNAGDNETDTLASVKIDFSGFGGGAAVDMSNNGGSWSASYTVTAGTIDAVNRNVSITVTDNAGNVTKGTGNANAVVDNIAPIITAGKITLSGNTGLSSTYKIGDIVTATWRAASDGNTDTLSAMSFDFSQFGGGSAVKGTESNGVWTAKYTLVAGAVDAVARNVAVTATDNAGNTVTTAGTNNAAVDSIAPAVTVANFTVSGATGTGGVFKIGDTVTASWNSGGDNESDSLSAVTVDFSQFGDTVPVVATNTGGVWTARFLIEDGTLDRVTKRNAMVTVIDNAGNAVTVTGADNAALDNHRPVMPDKPVLDAASDSGWANNDGITKVTTPIFSGKAEANSLITLYDTNGTTKLATTTASSNGSWKVELPAALTAGAHTILARVTDAAGNVSEISSGTPVFIETKAPILSIDAPLKASPKTLPGAIVGVVGASDPGERAMRFELLDTYDGHFTIDPKTGKVTIDTPIDPLSTATSYNITVRVTGAAGLTTDKVLTVGKGVYTPHQEIAPVEEAPPTTAPIIPTAPVIAPPAVTAPPPTITTSLAVQTSGGGGVGGGSGSGSGPSSSSSVSVGGTSTGANNSDGRRSITAGNQVLTISNMGGASSGGSSAGSGAGGNSIGSGGGGSAASGSSFGGNGGTGAFSGGANAGSSFGGSAGGGNAGSGGFTGGGNTGNAGNGADGSRGQGQGQGQGQDRGPDQGQGQDQNQGRQPADNRDNGAPAPGAPAQTPPGQAPGRRQTFLFDSAPLHKGPLSFTGQLAAADTFTLRCGQLDQAFAELSSTEQKLAA